MNRETSHKSVMRVRGFVSQEFGCAIAALMVCIALCLPILAAMRDGQISPLVGGLLIFAIALIFLIPKFMEIRSERSWRRRMKAREQDGQDQKKM